jgi:hypothetical protein
MNVREMSVNLWTVYRLNGKCMLHMLVNSFVLCLDKPVINFFRKTIYAELVNFN